MPKSPYLRDLFIKHFVAKAFHWTPDTMEKVTADELDALIFIEHEMHKKKEFDRKIEASKKR